MSANTEINERKANTKRRRDCAPPFLFPLICRRTRTGARKPNIHNFTYEREKRHTEPFKRICARPMIARKCAAFFPLRPFPLSYLRFVMFRKKIFEKIFPQKHAKYAEQNAEQIELDMLKILVYQGKTDI